MEELRPGLVPGALVQARGERWHLRDARRLDSVAIVTLDAADGASQPRAATLLLPFDHIDPIADRRALCRRRHVVVASVMDALSRVRPARGLWTAHSARLDLLPWQLAPAVAMLNGATRVLLADAVGLGKTIEAGLVIAELRARGLVERALVLAPAGVRHAWAGELRARFDLPVEVMDLQALLDLERTGAVGANPWSRSPIVVSSIDLVKRPEVRLAVESAPFDALIVDEAHHATPGTDRHAVVARLARRVPWLVLASATPHSGDTAAYRALLALGGLGVEDRICVFRRSHDDVRLSVSRRTHVLDVRSTREERDLHSAVLAYARELCHGAAAGSAGVQLLASTLARRAISSPWAVHETLRRRFHGLAGDGDHTAPAAPFLPWEEVDEPEQASPWLGAPGLPDGAAERERVRGLMTLAARAGANWSKGVRLLRLLTRLCEPAIVFTEFRDTLEACRMVLEPLVPITCLHGQLDAAERRLRLAAFLEGRVRVLVTTDVTAEGLNLQGPSRLVISMEWPWNPLRIEQRIGRVHRLGQSRRVHAIHLTAHESYEQTVIARVLRRAARASADLTQTFDETERMVTAEVLGVAIAEGSKDSPPTSVPQSGVDTESEAARVAHLRRFAAVGRSSRTHATVWALPRRGTGGARVVAIIEVRRADAPGLWSSEIVAVDVTLTTAPLNRRAWRSVCRRLVDDPRVREAALAVPRASDADRWAALRLRLARLRVIRHAERGPFTQPSLFDRRSIREAENRAGVRARWDEWQARLEARVQPSRRTPAVATRVLAILPLEAGRGSR
jgi:superfamily II DNA or RNA helicase